MTIRDRDRKILWSRAGNCCSICRTLLVRSSEVGGALTIIGEECHVVSHAGEGPRAGLPVDDIDGYGNLILLCPNDHRLIDTLVVDYPADRLLEIKRTHEHWVRKTLEQSPGVTAVTIARGQPTFLRLLETALDVLSVTASAEESSFDYEDLASEEEAELVGDFLQRVHDDSEMWDDYEPASRVRYAYDLDREMEDFVQRGWRVFGARVRGSLRGGMGGADTPWETAYIRLVRVDSPNIIKLDPPDGVAPGGAANPQGEGPA